MKRNPALDIVRIVATFCVLSFHYLACIGFMDVYMVGIRMYILCLMRGAFSVCVPLFIILTGYLMGKKQLSARFYLGIVKTLAIYVMASIICEWAKYGVPGWGFLGKLTSGYGTGYSWYIQMYTGLFLLIPFLNMMYRGDKTMQEPASKRYKHVLIGTLLVLSALPQVTNIFSFSRAWWKHPSTSHDYVSLLSTYWTGLYPFAYYMIGCYFAEYGLKIRRSTCGILLVVVILAKGSFDFYRADGLEYAFGTWQDYGSLFQVIHAVLAFHWLSTVNTSRFGAGLRKGLKTVSDLCLGIYLVSQVFEELFYPMMTERVASVGHRLVYYPVMIVPVFLCSMALSWVLNGVFDVVWKRVLGAARKKEKTA